MWFYRVSQRINPDRPDWVNPYYVEVGHMEPNKTLLWVLTTTGDFQVIEKTEYGQNHFNLPFSGEVFARGRIDMDRHEGSCVTDRDELPELHSHQLMKILLSKLLGYNDVQFYIWDDATSTYGLEIEKYIEKEKIDL